MKIEANKVVSFHYALCEVDGEQLETTDSSEPLTYLYGHGNVLAAIEHAMSGKQAGDKFQITLSPAQAYGPRHDNAEQRVPIKHIVKTAKKTPALRPGLTIKINTEKGPRDVRIIKVGKFNIDVDTNHPLAGLSLSFDLEIVDVRDATPQEIAHRHVHREGGHAH